MDALIEQAVESILSAQALMITAGAGMGVDSGLPDFRGRQGFWRAYPPLARLGISFEEMANPAWFDDDPELAWGFYGHRLHLYRDTQPHEGFEILRRWACGMKGGIAVFSSNVDGHFQKAGFSTCPVVECHGSIHHLQCNRTCSSGIWSAEGLELTVDPENLRLEGDLPRCPDCGAVARPNILMFGDWSWRPERSRQQETALGEWLHLVKDREQKLVIIEIGAGRALPTVRRFSEGLSSTMGADLIRINPREPEVPGEGIALSGGALEILSQMDELCSNFAS